MHLVWFVTVGAMFSIILGEFGQFPFGTSNASFSITDLILSLVICLLFIWQVETKSIPKIPKIFLIMILFWGVGLLSLIFSGNLIGGIYLVRFVIYSMSLYLGFSLVKNHVIHIEQICTILGFVGVILSLLGFLQLVLFPDLQVLYEYGYDPHKNRLFSTFLDPNLLGSFLNITFIAVLYLYFKHKRPLTLLWAFLITIAIILTFSRSAYLMFGIEVLCFFGFYSRKVLGLLVLFGILILLIVTPIRERIMGAVFIDKSASERITSWQDGFTIIRKYPLLGVGFNNLRDLKMEENFLKNDEKSSVHSGSGLDSSLLFVGATSGVVGIIIYLSFWIYLISLIIRQLGGQHRLISVCLLSLTFGIVANSQFINSLFFTPVVFVLFLLIGGYIAVTEPHS